MGSAKKEPDTLENICKNLAEYAVNRDEIKDLVTTLPGDQGINTITVDYELQLLKIVTIGWSISVYMVSNPKKSLFEVKFWELIREFSRDISNVTNLMIGQDIDYFDLIKNRFDTYLDAMEKSDSKADPASAIGPAFAELSKEKDNPFVIISGARLFNYSVRATKEYLESEGLCQ